MLCVTCSQPYTGAFRCNRCGKPLHHFEACCGKFTYDDVEGDIELSSGTCKPCYQEEDEYAQFGGEDDAEDGEKT